MSYIQLNEKRLLQKLVDDNDSFLFDCDGVIWHGNHLIDGVKPVLGYLRSRGKKLIFITNSATKSRADLKMQFELLGLRVDLDEIYGSAYATALYVSRILKLPSHKKAYVIGEKGLEDELASENIRTCGGTDLQDNVFIPLMDFSSISSDPDVGAVICGFDTNINYKKLAKAHRYLQENKDCHFVLANDDSTFPSSDGYQYPGSGSLSAPLRFMVAKKPIVVGKPNRPMMDSIVEKHHLDPKRTLMVGDRLDTDILFGINGGLNTLMVLTGVSKLDEIRGPGAEIVPQYVTRSLGDFAVLVE